MVATQRKRSYHSSGQKIIPLQFGPYVKYERRYSTLTSRRRFSLTVPLYLQSLFVWTAKASGYCSLKNFKTIALLCLYELIAILYCLYSIRPSPPAPLDVLHIQQCGAGQACLLLLVGTGLKYKHTDRSIFFCVNCENNFAKKYKRFTK